MVYSIRLCSLSLVYVYVCTTAHVLSMYVIVSTYAYVCMCTAVTAHAFYYRCVCVYPCDVIV